MSPADCYNHRERENSATDNISNPPVKKAPVSATRMATARAMSPLSNPCGRHGVTEVVPRVFDRFGEG